MNPDYAIRADSADCYDSEMIIYTLAYHQGSPGVTAVDYVSNSIHYPWHSPLKSPVLTSAIPNEVTHKECCQPLVMLYNCG